MIVTFLGTGTSTGVPVVGCRCRVCTSGDRRDQRLRQSVKIEAKGKHFLIDTSRNGLGTTEWCNPRGQALGVTPTTNTGHPLVDAFLWIKQPGESDGTCGGGPRAGNWWTDIALELSRAASSLARTIGR